MSNAKFMFLPAVSHIESAASLAFLPRNFDFTATRSNISSLKIKGTRRRVVNMLGRRALSVNEKGSSAEDSNKVIVEGTMVLMERTVLGYNDLSAVVVDHLDEMSGRKISVELVSSVQGDPANDMRGSRSKPAYLENWKSTSHGWKPGETAFKIKFDWSKDLGVPGALIIRNNHHKEFYLKSVTLDGIPNHDKLHFVCNSWIYPLKCYKNEHRIFFSNKAYLPNETPKPLTRYRAEELETLRGNGKGELKEWDRVYDYAYYNDLGKPDKGSEHARPVLGGSKQYPYPRRGRTGRPPTKTGHALEAGLEGLDATPTEFDCMEDTLKLYKEGIQLPDVPILKEKPMLNWLNKLLHIHGSPHLKFPLPHIIKEHSSAWTSDEEFAREMLAGVNPVIIRRLEVFPPISKLDPKAYGDQSSSIRKDHIESSLEGLTVDEAIKNKKLFILDHHDALMPYLRRINTTATKTYATRTLLFLKDDGSLKPLAIELSLPHPEGDDRGAVRKVFTPAERGVEGSIWQLAKVYVSVNDSGYHQLISHWLNTHAVMEPFVIATNRQLSVLHPIHKLLHPHFRDTMSINALARQMLIGAGGILEKTVFPGKYAMEMSSAVYRSWVFKDQALPNDLVMRGMAEKDPESPHGCRLLIEDYPYAVDGLQIWSAIEEWVTDYCSFYYKTNDMVINDTELQSWWKEVREEGHGDLKDETWWPEMKTVEDLIETCTIIIWIASALHAAVNFGQYPYAGYLPNRPTISRRFMPEPDTLEFEELETNFETALLKTITSQFKTLLGVSLIEILSTHSSDEVYLGQRDSQEWISDVIPLEAFDKFGKRLEKIEAEITERNRSGELRNRFGPVKMPYTLLIHSSEPGVTARGIPNSVSI